ncbi:MAG: glycosyl transferase family 1, partial [Candidatus Electrothrix sp. AUS1_2]|nr:glycosyl transferase family 1 [Candidatus Electrothrix sp. AUS1_2]
YVFKRDDAVDLSNKLIKALSNKKKTEKISVKALNLMKEHYNWNDIGEKTFSLYNSIK